MNNIQSVRHLFLYIHTIVSIRDALQIHSQVLARASSIPNPANEYIQNTSRMQSMKSSLSFLPVFFLQS